MEHMPLVITSTGIVSARAPGSAPAAASAAAAPAAAPAASSKPAAVPKKLPVPSKLPTVPTEGIKRTSSGERIDSHSNVITSIKRHSLPAPAGFTKLSNVDQDIPDKIIEVFRNDVSGAVYRREFDM